MSSPGLQHCKISPQGRRTHVKCNHCPWENTYLDPVVAQRMASNHIVKLHKNLALPVSQQSPEPKRPYTRRNKPVLTAVRFCPCCGTNLEAVRVALSIT